VDRVTGSAIRGWCDCKTKAIVSKGYTMYQKGSVDIVSRRALQPAEKFEWTHVNVMPIIIGALPKDSA
jgi:hypothetical protein